MGYSRSSSADWTTYSSTTSTKTRSQIFTSSGLHADMDPRGVTMREARDSDLNPESTPIIIATDVTGSMGYLAEHIVKEGLATLFKEIYERKPVTDPQVMPMAVGDAVMFDKAPFQIGQFEADLVAAEWLEKIYIEGNGGGNGFESYDLPYYFGAFHTSTDAFEKRNKKGYIFTIGDEEAPPMTSVDAVRKVMGDSAAIEVDMPFIEILERASKMYHCFHIMIAEGSHARWKPDRVKTTWREALGERAVWLEDHEKLAETIVSIIQVVNGADKADVAKSWSGDTSLVVADAIKDLDAGTDYDDAMKVVRF